MSAESRFRYDSSDFPHFAVTVDVVLFTIEDDELKLLLIQRANEPYLGAWALPGGFVRIDEDLRQAAARELEEETGLSEGDWHLQQLGTYGAPDRDPRMRVVSVAFWAICASLPTPRGGGDASRAELADVKRVRDGRIRLAFDHEQIVRDAVERTRSELENSALAAKFCPPTFTIRELRRVYEIIWGIQLDPGNFQRFVRDSGVFEPYEDEFEMSADFSLTHVEEARPVLRGSPSESSTRRSRRGRRASLWTARNLQSDRAIPASSRLKMPRARERIERNPGEDG